ncbi:methyltransferase domain-containing protein [Nonomuraea lactucae]|uniref:methyltransferase domain-containing protein n=1 Tax=Nonomuraea lactucae TaxID=2249762 RepID=UPI000DE515C0|nr:methyltransferase domain-containing protein [Nonomuraea lactucae]
MIAALGENRGLISDTIVDALRAVPRHLFVPPVGVALTDTGPELIDQANDPEAWWTAVYGTAAIVTQLDGGATDIGDAEGRYTSSNSAPETVVDLLELLNPQPQHRTLEVGTGTGWTAALLSHLVGEAARVTSIEIDPAIAGQAAKNLATAGVRPRLIVGDGAAGWAAGAPYDRVHVTCGVHTVPYAWIEQSRPGAVIVAPYSPGFDTDQSLRLVVRPDGTAIGRFPGYTSYMMMRSQGATPCDPDDGSGKRFAIRVDPRTIAYAPAGAGLVMSALTGLRTRVSDEAGFVLYLVDPGDAGQWAAAVHRSDTEHMVYELGDRRLWEEVADAYFRWVSWGEPGLDRFGMTVTPEGQRLWLDTPERAIGPCRSAVS